MKKSSNEIIFKWNNLGMKIKTYLKFQWGMYCHRWSLCYGWSFDEEKLEKKVEPSTVEQGAMVRVVWVSSVSQVSRSVSVEVLPRVWRSLPHRQVSCEERFWYSTHKSSPVLYYEQIDYESGWRRRERWEEGMMMGRENVECVRIILSENRTSIRHSLPSSSNPFHTLLPSPLFNYLKF